MSDEEKASESTGNTLYTQKRLASKSSTKRYVAVIPFQHLQGLQQPNQRNLQMAAEQVLQNLGQVAPNLKDRRRPLLRP